MQYYLKNLTYLLILYYLNECQIIEVSLYCMVVFAYVAGHN